MSQYHDASRIRLPIEGFVIASGNLLVYAHYLTRTSLGEIILNKDL
jgi:hypothetical protein